MKLTEIVQKCPFKQQLDELWGNWDVVKSFEDEGKLSFLITPPKVIDVYGIYLSFDYGYCVDAEDTYMPDFVEVGPLETEHLDLDEAMMIDTEEDLKLFTEYLNKFPMLQYYGMDEVKQGFEQYKQDSTTKEENND